MDDVSVGVLAKHFAPPAPSGLCALGVNEHPAMEEHAKAGNAKHTCSSLLGSLEPGRLFANT